tara:strand:+ start:1285 stop:1950 length:666 start_codon:yes stop_codon:yes gene_type:complete
MPGSARLCLFSGLLVLALAVFNALTADAFTPSLQRAEVLSGMAAVGLMLVAVLWTRAIPLSPKTVDLEGEQGLVMADELSDGLRTELAWGSHQFLTATSAASILVYWDDKVLLRRGLITDDSFCPGEICRRSTERQTLVSLVRTALYPGRQEFDAVLPGLPAVMVQPLGRRGWIVLGGWSERCFTRSDERWLAGWAERLRTELELIPAIADCDQQHHPKET